MSRYSQCPEYNKKLQDMCRSKPGFGPPPQSVKSESVVVLVGREG